MEKFKTAIARAWARGGFYLSLAAALALVGGGAYAIRNKPAPEAPKAMPPAPVISSLDESLSARAPEVKETLPALTPPVSGREIQVGFSQSPVWSQTLSLYQAHEGLDIAAVAGEAVCASLDGTVQSAEKDPLYGYVIELTHEDGLITRYANLSTIQLVKVGDRVKAGQIIGAVGFSAICESAQDAHVHFEAWRDGLWMGDTLTNGDD